MFPRSGPYLLVCYPPGNLYGAGVPVGAPCARFRGGVSGYGKLCAEAGVRVVAGRVGRDI